MLKNISSDSSHYLYQASVIIPVYNASKTIARTMESLFKQTLPKSQFEILLIDDGSTDGSGALCDEYAKKYTDGFVKVWHQDNKGVSAARNKGIREANGRYIFFLDSDDEFTESTIQNVIDFFLNHDNEVDLVTFPIEYINEDGTKFEHWRYRNILNESKVYHLDNPEAVYISQTTMNICVRNDKENYFDESMDYNEDQVYITTVVVKKNALGCVLDAQYLYHRTQSGGAATGFLLLNSLDSVLKKIHIYFELKKKYPQSSSYIDALILYDFEWRIKADYFLPYHLLGNDFLNSMKTIQEILNHIDSNVICADPILNIAYKYYLLSLKKKDLISVQEGKQLLLTYEKAGKRIEPLFARGRVDIVVNQLKIKKNHIYFLGYVKSLEAQLMEENQVKLWVSFGGELREIPLFHSQFSCFGTNMETNQFYGFAIKVDLEKITEIRPYVQVGKCKYPAQFYYGTKTAVNTEVHRTYYKGSKYSLICFKDLIKVILSNSSELSQKEKDFNQYIRRMYPKHWLFRQLMIAYSHGKKDTWLYYDSHDAIDNGFYQFEHDIGIHDGVKRYYVYSKDKKEILPEGAVKKYREHLIEFGSKRHKLMLGRTSKVLAAYAGRNSYIPYSRLGEKIYKDLLDFEVIYLQHGVMNAKLPNMYSKEKMYGIDKVVISTGFERENLLKLAYEPEDLLSCGMPRFDYFSNSSSAKHSNKVLFAPSWRKMLVATVDRRQVPVSAFYNSTFFKSYYGFLHSQKLSAFLEKEDLYLDVQFHPMFSCYDQAFELDGMERIHLVHFSSAADYACCITDFSSIMFDYIYLDKPVISYFPDKKEFLAGIHTYREFCFPLTENGFVMPAENRDMVIDKLDYLCRNQMKMTADIQARADKLFFSKEPSHRDALYKMLTREYNE